MNAILVRNFSTMPWARRGGSFSKNDRREHHQRVDGPAPRVVADQHRAPARRHVVDAEDADAEVVPVEEAEQGEHPRDVDLGRAVGIEAVSVPGQLDALDAPEDVVGDEKGHQRIRSESRNAAPSPEPTSSKSMSPSPFMSSASKTWVEPAHSSRLMTPSPSRSKTWKNFAHEVPPLAVDEEVEPLADLLLQRQRGAAEAVEPLGELVLGERVVGVGAAEARLVDGDARDRRDAGGGRVEAARQHRLGHRQPGEEVGRDEEAVATGGSHHLLEVAKAPGHDLRREIVVSVIVVDAPDEGAAGILGGRVDLDAALVAVPVDDAADERRDQRGAGLGGGDRLVHAEDQRQAGVDAFLLQDLGGADALPGRRGMRMRTRLRGAPPASKWLTSQRARSTRPRTSLASRASRSMAMRPGMRPRRRMPSWTASQSIPRRTT